MKAEREKDIVFAEDIWISIYDQDIVRGTIRTLPPENQNTRKQGTIVHIGL